MIKFKNTISPLIIITTETAWLETPRMRHYVTHQLSLYFNVVFVELDSRGTSKTYRINDNLVVYKLGFAPPGINRFNLLRIFWNIFQSQRIFWMLKRVESKKIILLNFKFGFYQVYRSSIWALKYYFINDDFINMPPNVSTREIRKRRSLQSKVLINCNRIFVSSEALLDYSQVKDLEFNIILSGHDFEIKYFKEKIKVGSSEKIKLCLMGFINNNLELDWIDHLANYDFFDINFIGPVEDKNILFRYKNKPNVSFHKPLTGRELQNFLLQFDVMLMPYKPIEINIKASVPAKLFQYLACGKPIVSGIMPNLMVLPDKFVYQCHDKYSFLDSILKSYNDDSIDLINARCEFSSNHTWNNRGLLLSNIIISDLSRI
jgi:hypothetical protein